MKVTKREQMLVGALLLVLLGYCFYQFILIKQNQQITKLKASRDTYSQKWEQVKAKIASKDNENEQYTMLNSKILSKTDMLFPSIQQEEIIVILDKMIKYSNVQADVLGFSEVTGENITTADASKTANTVVNSTNASNELDKLVSDFNGTSIKNSTSVNTNTSNTSTNTDNSKIVGAYKMEVTINFKGVYDELTSFIGQVENYNQKIAINNINVTGAQGSNVSGTIVLDFYGVPRLNNKDDFKWDYKAPSGNESPYLGSSSSLQVTTPTTTNQVASTAVKSTSTVTNSTSTVTKSVSTAANVETKNDFILYAKPKTTNKLHTITIEKAKDESMKSYVYANNAGIELVEFYFTKIGSKYYYKYKTSTKSYPSNFNNYIEFVPNGGNIVLDMVSQKRSSSSDLSGANIRITNDTDKSVDVNILGDDKNKPRLSIIKEKGDISVVRSYINYISK